MSSKTRLDKNFFLNLLLTANYFFHNKIKFSKSSKNINQKLKQLASMLKLKKNDLENYFLYLMERNIIFQDNNYYFVNMNLLKKLIKFKAEKISNNIILQSNFELLVKPEIDLRSFFFLVQIAEIINRDVVYRFTLTENSLHNAFLHRLTAQEIKDFLSTHISSRSLPHNVEYLIDDIHKRTGEIRLGNSSGYVKAEGPILKSLMNDVFGRHSIIRTISPTTALLKNDINLWDLYHYFKERKFFPIVDSDKAVKTEDMINISLNMEEAEYFLSALYTLKEIGFEHQLKINFTLLDNLCDRIEDIIGSKIKTKAGEKSKKYKLELKNSIKSYVLNSLKASLTVPSNLILNKIAFNYDGNNPATTKKDIISMLNFALRHKLSILLAYNSFSKKNEHFVEPKYLYNDKVLYYYHKDKRTKESTELNKIVYTALI